MVCYYVVLLCFFTALALQLPSLEDNSEETLKIDIYDGLIKYEETGIKTLRFESAVNQLQIPTIFFRREMAQLKKIGVCIGCAAAFKYFLVRNQSGLSRDDLVRMLIFVCVLFNIQTERVCKGVVELNIDIFIYIASRKPSLKEQTACAIIFQNYDCFKSHRPQWSVTIPPGYSLAKSHKTTLNSENFRVLHLTDVHIDLLYEPGANAVCGEPLCCQKDQGNGSKPEDGAGKWGDYRDCDMPYYSLVDTLQQIVKNQPQFSYVYFTGDIISHRIWETSKNNNIEIIKKIYQLFKDSFGSIPVFPILGNHEPHPLNVFSPHSITEPALSTQWLFDLMVEEWSHWLSNETYNTIRYGGYYTVVVEPGFRIIALNSNVCYVYNWWLLYEDEDQFNQLHWLSVVLTEAEAKNESVHILSHVPPGEDTCLQEWTRQFRRIVERFSNIITGQFNGHTHYDELRVFYNTSNLSEAINVAYNGGSFTSFSNLNPNYRFYEIDSENYEVEDFEEWTYDIEEANTQPDKSPNWYKLYSFREAYGLKSMNPTDIGNLVSAMAHNRSLVEQYYRFKVRAAKPLLMEECGDECIHENLCSIVTTEADDNTQCDAFT